MGIRRLAVLLGLAVALPAYAGTVSGRLADSKGNPVTGARVVWYAYRQPERALLERTKGTARTPLGEGKTDANGSFKVTFDKPAEGISLEVSAAGLPSIELEGPYDAADQANDIECLLPLTERVSGRFVDEAGKPIPGVSLRAYVGAEFQDAEGDGTAFQETVSRSDGTFLLENAPKAAVLRAELSGFASLTQFTSRSPTALTLILKKGGSIEGRVLDLSGHPAAGAIVLGAGFAFETDAEGNYRIPAAAAGQSGVSASWKDDLVARRDSIPIRRGETARVDLSLSRSAVIAGTVIDSRSRRPIAGVRVTMSEGGPVFAPVSGRSSRTDAQGRFRVTGLLARTYRVTAAHRDYQSATLIGVRTSIAAPASVALALQKSTSVSGRVVDEKNNPVPGARVSALPVPFGRRALLKGITKVPSTKSLADGSFRLRGAPPDPVLSIEARKPGFVTAQRHGLQSTEGGPKGITMVLRRGLEARGSVVDAQGQPVAGAELRMQKRARSEGQMAFYTESNDRAAPAAVSDSQGRFSVLGLEPGDFSGRLLREGYANKSIPLLRVEPDGMTVWPPFAIEASASIAGIVRDRKGEPVSGAQIFSYASEMSSSATTDVQGNFRLDGYSAGKTVTVSVMATGYARAQASATAPAEALAIVLPTTGEVRGRVEDAETRAPVETFSVRVTPARTNPSRGGGLGSELQSPDGSFTIPNVPPGKNDVSGSAPGYLETSIAGIELAEGESKEGIVLSLKRGRDVTGRVLDPSSGTGVANATVSWRREHESVSEGFTFTGTGTYIYSPTSATTDANGRFLYEGLPPERLVFTAFHPDYQETTKGIDAAAESTIDVTLAAGASISGTVLDRDGRTPVVGAEVGLEELGESSQSWKSDSVRSDGSGRFRFEHMKEGRFRVSARSESGRSPAREVVLAPEQRTDDVLLQFLGGARINGRVTGLPAGKLGGLTVFAGARDFQTRTATADDGSFLFEDVPPGPVRVSASTGMPGRSVMKAADVPEGGGETSVEIVFETGSKLSGRVMRADKGVSGVFVNTTPDPAVAGLARAFASTDMDGRYEIDGLPDAPYRLQFSGAGVNTTRRVTVSGDTSFDMTLGAAGLSGVITDSASGEALANVKIRAEKGADASGVSAPAAVSDSKGYYSIGDLDAGTYQVTAQRIGYQQKVQDVSVGEASTEANFSLVRGSGLAITALDGLTGLPLKGLDVLAQSAGGGTAFQSSVQLDASGRGEIAALAAGRYTFQVFSAGYAPRVLPSIEIPSAPLTIPMTPGGRVEIRCETQTAGKIYTAAGTLVLRSAFFTDGTANLSPPVNVLNGVEPGSYVLVVTAPGGNKSYPFRVTEGQTTTVTIGP